MHIEELRELVRQGKHRVSDHAFWEGLKEGITVADMEQAVLNGEIIEDYPKRTRCLVSGTSVGGLPIHVLCEYTNPNQPEFVTTYIPQREYWIKPKRRKVRRRGKR